MKTLSNLTAVGLTLAAVALVGAGVYYTFHFAAGAYRELAPALTPAFEAGLIAALLGAALVALAVRWSAARRSADALRGDKASLYGQLLEALTTGGELPALERRLAVLGGGAVIRAWREVRAGATPKAVTRLVRAMRRELGQGNAGFGDEALLALLGARRTQRGTAPFEAAGAS